MKIKSLQTLTAAQKRHIRHALKDGGNDGITETYIGEMAVYIDHAACRGRIWNRAKPWETAFFGFE